VSPNECSYAEGKTIFKNPTAFGNEPQDGSQFLPGVQGLGDACDDSPHGCLEDAKPRLLPYVRDWPQKHISHRVVIMT